MKKIEKIRKVYQKYGGYISDESIANIMKDKERTREIIRLYKKEEMDSMNYILGKPENNKIFTKFELEAMNKIDLFDRNVIEICKEIWKNKDNPEKVNKILKVINGKGCLYESIANI